MTRASGIRLNLLPLFFGSFGVGVGVDHGVNKKRMGLVVKKEKQP